MGACCSCHRGSPDRYFLEEEDEIRDVVREENIVLKGEDGSRIRLLGSSKYISMYTQQGMKGYNQDAMTVWESFTGDKNMFFCGVFDGHGPSGHKVAGYIRDNLPAKISSMYREAGGNANNSVSMDIGEDEDQTPEAKNPLYLSWKARLTKGFHEMDQQLEAYTSIQSYCSGTTSVCVIKKGEHLMITNLGDSRAIMCTRDDTDRLVSKQLTVDLKPNVPGEIERIKRHNGRVLPMEGDPNVYRIWLPNEDCPGLAMARAFGDFCLKDYGLISTPQVFYRKISEKDEFVVLATDGVWDALSNDEVVKVVASARQRSTAAKMVVKRATAAWRHRFPRAKMDDCAVVCLFFKRQKAVLTRSVSEVSQLSFNYMAVDTRDDGMDTVLNCKIGDSPEGGVNGPDMVPRRRRPSSGPKHGN